MLKIIAIAAGVVFVLVIAFIVWRWTSVARGVRQRDNRLLQRLIPIGKRIKAVGPEPYADKPAAFSRVRHIEGEVKPSELVDWYVGLLAPK